tara:strand:- start:7797 stop:8045 length:249 start_codon:yes stop_codon:yes gene_type:complete
MDSGNTNKPYQSALFPLFPMFPVKINRRELSAALVFTLCTKLRVCNERKAALVGDAISVALLGLVKLFNGFIHSLLHPVLKV